MVQTVTMDLPATFRVPRGLTVDGASPELLGELLDALSFETRRLGAPIDDALQPGIGRQQIVDELGDIGLTPPEELVTWWGWHNGVRSGVVGTRSLALASLQFAIRKWQTSPHGDDSYSWNTSWLLVQGPGSYGMAICTDEREPGPLVRGVEGAMGTGPDDFANQMVSLCTPVTWWLLARANGWTRWDPSLTTWTTDIDKFPLEWRLTEVAHF